MAFIILKIMLARDGAEISSGRYSRISDRPELEDICIGSNLHSRGKCNKEEKEDDDGLEPVFFL